MWFGLVVIELVQVGLVWSICFDFEFSMTWLSVVLFGCDWFSLGQFGLV